MKDGFLAQYGIDPPRLTLLRRLKRGAGYAAGIAIMVAHELVSVPRLPLGKALRAWRRGFLQQTWLLYDMDHNDPANYVPDLVQRFRSPRLNGVTGQHLTDKYTFTLLMDRFGLTYPALHAVVRHGRILPQKEAPPADPGRYLRRLLRQHPRLVLKPLWACKGRGIAFVEERAGEYRINGRPAPFADVAALTGQLDDYVITDFVSQAAYATGMYPHTPNSIRILTLWDCASRTPFVAAAAQRVGTSRSAPVDNFKAGLGGLSAAVDVESGVLGAGVELTHEGRRVRHAVHPETGGGIEGVRLPFWQDTVDNILEAAAGVPHMPCIAWDVLLTDSGYSVLEINDTPGLYVHEVHAPMLTDPRVRRFYREYGFIGRA